MTDPRGAFADLLDANRDYAASFSLAGFDGIARAGVAMVTCMDSRIDPLGMIGIEPGDAKILRNPGGRVTDQALVALVIGVNLLNVNRILVVHHTRCAMAQRSEAELHEAITRRSGVDATWMSLGVIDDQQRAVRAEVAKARSHPLIPDYVAVGGFIYDVDTGELTQIA
ncbi:MAG TPA: carbonic anhydrase [Actinomycetaceae bacterium]|nr:carbonic anhydrase [Actinomycetaceae bacterium]